MGCVSKLGFYQCWDIYSIYWYIFRDIGKEEEEEEKVEESVFARDQLMKSKQNNGFPFRRCV